MKQHYCTRCKSLLIDIAVDLSLYISIDRQIESKWEKINNSEIINSELLCIDCFNKFFNKIETFKKE